MFKYKCRGHKDRGVLICAKILGDFDKAGVKNIILDLRNNPGGYLDSAVEIAQMTVPEGPIVTTVFRDESAS